MSISLNFILACQLRISAAFVHVYVASQRIQDFLKAFFHVFPMRNEVLSGEQEIELLYIYYSCEGEIEKACPLGSPFDITRQPRNANR